MSFFPASVVAEVGRVARVFYIDRSLATHWNQHRREAGDLRLLTGWGWQSRDGRKSRCGFKTQSIAIRDAYYMLIHHREQPADVRRPKLIELNTSAKREAA